MVSDTICYIAENGGEIAMVTDDDTAVEPEPVSHRREFLRELGCHLVAIDARLGERAEREELAGGTIGLEVDAAHDPIAE